MRRNVLNNAVGIPAKTTSGSHGASVDGGKMGRSRWRVVACTSFGLWLPCGLAAQQSADTLKTIIDVGMFNVAGNTSVTAINVGENIAYASGPWAATQFFTVVYGRTDTITTASHWKGGGEVIANRAPICRCTCRGRSSGAPSPVSRGAARRPPVLRPS